MELFVALKMLVTVVCEVKKKIRLDFEEWKIIQIKLLDLGTLWTHNDSEVY